MEGKIATQRARLVAKTGNKHQQRRKIKRKQQNRHKSGMLVIIAELCTPKMS